MTPVWKDSFDLDVERAARWSAQFGITRQQIVAALHSGELEALPWGEGDWRITPAALDKWCKRNKSDRTIGGVSEIG